ncbi:hypothetical protein pb186bvf_000454 [Paramecium bursaria]
MQKPIIFHNNKNRLNSLKQDFKFQLKSDYNLMKEYIGRYLLVKEL